MARHFVLNGRFQANILGEFVLPIVNLSLQTGDFILKGDIGGLNPIQSDVKFGAFSLKIVATDGETILLLLVHVKLGLQHRLVVLDRVQFKSHDVVPCIIEGANQDRDRVDLSLDGVHLHLHVSIKALEFGDLDLVIG